MVIRECVVKYTGPAQQGMYSDSCVNVCYRYPIPRFLAALLLHKDINTRGR